MASIIPVTGVGKGPGPREGVLVALKLSRPDDALSVDALNKEIVVFEALCRAPGEPPCPRLFDVVDHPAPGLVMEWCPTDLERWWAERHADRTGIADLCEALAAVCRRVREYAVVSEMELGRRVVHADIKPRNILLSEEGRWLLTDFGAAKSRAVDDEAWIATKMIIGTENYISPETLFNARKPHPAALDTWSIGCTFFALLRMRSLLRGGGKMPPNGTHAHHFRTHRAALVGDLQLRRPNIFADRLLDPAMFTSPERLPDKDRAAVADAIRGLFDNPNLEDRLIADAVNLLDRALQIDPERRYVDPIEMAGDLEALGTRARELAARADGGPTGPRVSAPSIAAPSLSSASVEPIRVRPKARSSRWMWWLAGGVALGAALLVFMLGIGGIAWWRMSASDVATAPAVVAVAPVLVSTPEGVPSAPSVVATADPTQSEAAATMAAPEPPVVDPPAPGSAAPSKKKAPASATVGGAPAKGSGVFLVFGADAYLVARGARHSTGTVPAGKYELFAAVGAGGGFVSQGAVVVAAGQRAVWRCGFGKCRLGEVIDEVEEEEEEGEEEEEEE